MFKELDERTNELTRSVGELKALGEVSQAVSSTLDLETVLTRIVSHAVQLSGTDGGAIYEYDEASEEFHLRATDHMEEELITALRNNPPRLGDGVVGRAAASREPVVVPNILEERAYAPRMRQMLERFGFRASLAVPLLREDRIIGGLVVRRKSTGEFRPEVIELLKTFATQSVLAIQNARLFREIEEKSQQIEAANRHKSEFLANMSHELRTPLNAIIGFSEVLQERLFGELNEKQAEYTDDILTSGRHLLSLINEILDLSKVEAGRMELETGYVRSSFGHRQRAHLRARARHQSWDHARGKSRRASGRHRRRRAEDQADTAQSAYPTRSSSPRRADGSRSTPDRPTAQWKSPSPTPASASPKRTSQRSSRSFARWAVTTRKRSKEPDWD